MQVETTIEETEIGSTQKNTLSLMTDPEDREAEMTDTQDTTKEEAPLPKNQEETNIAIKTTNAEALVQVEDADLTESVKETIATVIGIQETKIDKIETGLIVNVELIVNAQIAKEEIENELTVNAMTVSEMTVKRLTANVELIEKEETAIGNNETEIELVTTSTKTNIKAAKEAHLHTQSTMNLDQHANS